MRILTTMMVHGCMGIAGVCGLLDISAALALALGVADDGDVQPCGEEEGGGGAPPSCDEEDASASASPMPPPHRTATTTRWTLSCLLSAIADMVTDLWTTYPSDATRSTFVWLLMSLGVMRLIPLYILMMMLTTSAATEPGLWWLIAYSFAIEAAWIGAELARGALHRERGRCAVACLGLLTAAFAGLAACVSSSSSGGGAASLE